MLQSKYNLSQSLYASIKSSFRSEADKELKEINILLKELPSKLRAELQYYQFKKTFEMIDFFKDKPPAFLAWVSQNILQEIRTEEEYLYYEGDQANGIYVLVQGSCGHVLPKYDSVKYINIDEGSLFGVSDIFFHLLKNDYDLFEDDWTQDVIIR